ncbi:hypothetical protein COCNU_scaffold000313G000010 [Cocos nucifera]|nr:hypothetical protein [Cocos nucifera]
MNLSSEDRMPDPPADKEKERGKRKVAIMMKAHKMRPDEPDRGSSEDQGVDSFVICSWQSSHHMLAHLKWTNRLDVELLKVRKDLQVEINHLQVMTVEVERLTVEKIVESESLRSALRWEEFVSARLKAALALKEKKKKEAKLKVAKLEAQLANPTEAFDKELEEENPSSGEEVEKNRGGSSSFLKECLGGDQRSHSPLKPTHEGLRRLQHLEGHF